MIQSSDKIYIDGTYFSHNPGLGKDDALWKADKVKSMLQKHRIAARSVCEVGSGSGMILQYLSEMFPEIEIFAGFDISPDAIKQSQKIQNNKLSFFQSSIPENKNFDLLLMLDVIEHVDDYYQFLRNIRHCSNQFIFHIPLDLSCRMILKPHILLNERKSVGHIHYFTKETIFWALEDTGYIIKDWFYTKPLTDTSASPNLFRWFKKKGRNMLFSIAPDLCARLFGSYSVMLYLEKNQSYEADNLDL